MRVVTWVMLLLAVAASTCYAGEYNYRLKKYGTICWERSDFEYVSSHNSTTTLMRIVSSGKCCCLLSDSSVPVRVVRGMFTVEVEYIWGDEVREGWTSYRMLEKGGE